ncbi:MAG: dihydrolipoyl dehydrogenase [Sulfuricurvum sp.]|uniref:dihydrolipoyl dehydrogenase n=1 Tax=Sulfuricurvum sp. TaxID=2025608 RepID=UPI002623C006|nr:dihydrolipoyl dehydrogenase [Sulfuricurvum sp.]MDD5160601.1 dihydrolipoyl dehydrogenase [Sulfuricurvum sp.]
MKQYDIVVIGAGPGGYESALELARSGMKTLLIERTKERIGGTCLNEGCIPTKNYLSGAAYASKASYFNDCGIVLEIKGLNLERLEEKTIMLKNEIRTGVMWLLEQAGVEILYGTAAFVDEHTVDVSGEQIRFDKCIIATGSQTKTIEQLPQDGKRILSSRDIFELKTLPSSIAIVGGGPIGCEFATFFSAFGVSVTVIVRGTQLLSGEDEEVAKALLRAFKKRNINVMTSTIINKAVVGEGGVELVLAGEGDVRMTCDIVLCATGRIPYTEALSPEKAGVRLNDQGFIEVNKAFQTTQKHIYAVGDCINTPAFAHTAYTEAHIAAHNLVHGSMDSNNHLTPYTIFTDPQIASCGLQEREAKAQGRAVIIKKAFFKTNAKAKIAGDDSGFAKLIVCADSGIILGATIIGVEATEIIHELIVAIEKEMRADDLSAVIHAHPTISEIIRLL